jgi:hypothetical protein
MSGVDTGDAIAIPADIRDLIEAARKRRHHNAYAWQDWQDAVLQEVWPHRRAMGLSVQAIVTILSARGQSVCSDTVRRRAGELGL